MCDCLCSGNLRQRPGDIWFHLNMADSFVPCFLKKKILEKKKKRDFPAGPTSARTIQSAPFQGDRAKEEERETVPFSSLRYGGRNREAAFQ